MNWHARSNFVSMRTKTFLSRFKFIVLSLSYRVCIFFVPFPCIFVRVGRESNRNRATRTYGHDLFRFFARPPPPPFLSFFLIQHIQNVF